MHAHLRIASILFIFCFVFPFASTCFAQTGGTHGLRVELGRSANHNGDDISPGVGIRYATGLGAGEYIRMELGAIAGEPYVGLDGGLELRFPARTAFKLLLRGGLGVLTEGDFTSEYFRRGAGVEYAAWPRVALRSVYRVTSHGGLDGPNLIAFGFEYRFSDNW